jgi:DNA-binding CsgD family transcriptional regulator
MPDEAPSHKCADTTFVIVAPGQLIACSIEYLVKNWIRSGNTIRVETENRLRRLLRLIAAGGGPPGDLLFIVDAVAFSGTGNALVAELCARSTNASAMYFGAELHCEAQKSDRISVFAKLSYTSSRIKWERHLRRLVKVNPQPALSPTTRALADPHSLRPLKHPEENGADSPLTARQSEVLGLVLRGMTNKQIALRIGLAESTVKAYVGELMAHFNVYRRTHLMALSLGGLS